MNTIDTLTREIETVQSAINGANRLMNAPPTNFGPQMIQGLKQNLPYLASRVKPQLEQAFRSGEPQKVLVEGAILCLLVAGAYGVDSIASVISVEKARKILLSAYEELAVKQNLLVEEQQKLIADIDAQGRLQQRELDSARARLDELNTQISRIAGVLSRRSV